MCVCGVCEYVCVSNPKYTISFIQLASIYHMSMAESTDYILLHESRHCPLHPLATTILIKCCTTIFEEITFVRLLCLVLSGSSPSL